jgi:DNA-binding response OmpR family regulator
VNNSILIIEDDVEINQLIARYLSKEGFKTFSLYTGREAINTINSGLYQMIILDLMIPYIDGYEILRRIREKCNIPVLIISAKAQNTDKIIGLGLGADDYITKPFDIDELVARVKAQLRRYLYFNKTGIPEKMILRNMDIEMNLESREVRVSGNPVTLTSKEFDILELFMTYPQRAFTKAQLFDAVWGEEYMGDDNTVMVHIHHLREKIEPNPSNPRYILTVWGIGYKLSEG